MIPELLLILLASSVLNSVEDEVSLSVTDETDELTASDSVTPLAIVEPLPSAPDPSYVETGYFIKKKYRTMNLCMYLR